MVHAFPSNDSVLALKVNLNAINLASTTRRPSAKLRCKKYMLLVVWCYALPLASDVPEMEAIFKNVNGLKQYDQTKWLTGTESGNSHQQSVP